MDIDSLDWKLQSSSQHGCNKAMTYSVEIDPWELGAATSMSSALAADGWTPVLPADVEATGASGGYAVVQRTVSITESEHSERFWLVGSIAFLNEDYTVALYVELMSGRIEKRRTLEETLDSVRATPLGLRWMGSIVQSGEGQRGRLRSVQLEMVDRYPTLVPNTGWLQVPFFAPNDTLRMNEAKIRDVRVGPAPRMPRGRKTRLQVRSRRSGSWRAIAARPVHVEPNGALRIGPHGFTAQARDGYIYLTVHGGVEPTYRMDAADYNALTNGKGEACLRSDSEIGGCTR